MTVGGLIEVGTPEGKFTFEPKFDKQKNYAAFVAGSGITPVMSILKIGFRRRTKKYFCIGLWK